MKKLILLMLFLTLSSNALELKDLNSPHDFMGIVSDKDKIEDTKENENIETKAHAPNVIQKEENIATQAKTSSNFADLSLKRLAEDINYELENESGEISSDLAILWQAASERSETMKYTIYKLANPDEDKPNDSRIKKILKPIANISSIAGASVSGDPFVATGALIGGGLLGAVMKDDKEYNYTFSKVSDADMVLLVRKIDELQKKLLNLYVDYRTKKELSRLADEYYKKRENNYKNAQNKSKEELIIADVSYRSAKANAQRAHDDYVTSRAILENLVGIDALNKIEQK